MTIKRISNSLHPGRLYSHALLSLILVFGISLTPGKHKKSFNEREREIKWDVTAHKIKSSTILSLALTNTMTTEQTQLLMGCYTSGVISVYEQSKKGLKALRTIGQVQGGITDIKLLSTTGALNKVVVSHEAKGVISIFDLTEDQPAMTLFHGAYGINVIEIADLNNDGLDDIIPISYDGKTHIWFENDQNEGFIKRYFNDTKSKVSAVSISDFDQDGDQDLLLASDYDKNISLLVNDGQGNFRSTILAEGITGVLDIAVMDMNMDGNLDLAYVSHQEKNVQLLQWHGDKLERKNISTKLHSLNNIRVFDLAQDGRPDLVISSFDDNTIRVIENTTEGLREHRLQAQIPSPADIALKTDRTTGELKLYVSSMSKSKIYEIDVVMKDGL